MARIKIPLVVETVVESEVKPAVKYKLIVPVKGASVKVAIRGGANTPIFEAETGGTTLAEPVHTDEFGNIPGWLNEGSYAVTVEGGEGAIEIPKTTYNLDLTVGQGDLKSEIETKLTSAEGKITSLETKVSTLETKVAALEADVSIGPWETLTLGTGWAIEVGSPTPAVRKEGTNARLRGQIYSTGMVSPEQEVFSVPAEFSPANRQVIPVTIKTNSNYISSTIYVEEKKGNFKAGVLSAIQAGILTPLITLDNIQFPLN